MVKRASVSVKPTVPVRSSASSWSAASWIAASLASVSLRVFGRSPLAIDLISFMWAPRSYFSACSGGSSSPAPSFGVALVMSDLVACHASSDSNDGMTRKRSVFMIAASIPFQYALSFADRRGCLDAPSSLEAACNSRATLLRFSLRRLSTFIL
ncbi:hypothetical protein ACHAXT_007602 [Thalassiosira profunda]